MKKRVAITITIVLLVVLIATGFLVWFLKYRSKAKNIYISTSQFVNSAERNQLTVKIAAADEVYQRRVSSIEDRLTTLNSVILKLDEFEADLNVYLVLSSKSSAVNEIVKNYQNLISKRRLLVDNLDEYITRMNGNIEAGGNAVQDLYNAMFEEVIDYIYDYNTCFYQTINYTFGKVESDTNIKKEIYSLYSHAVSDLLNNISSSKFKSTYTVEKLNSIILLEDNNIVLNPGLSGGEFNSIVAQFKECYSSCDKDALLTNFETYYTSYINETTETNVEKLTIFYLQEIFKKGLGG